MHRAIYEALLKDLQRLQRRLVTAQVMAARQDERLWARLVAQHAAAEVGGGLDEFVASAARRSTVLFLLRVVFVRVLEDLGLLSPPRVRGEVGHTFFRELFPALNHRAYFGAVFRDLAHDLPALFTPGDDELPLPPQDECEQVWALWHSPNKDGVEYRWDGDTFDSHFLGDLYQDLDADIRKHYALLQTPPFVEAFLLRHTLTPALVAFPPEALAARGETFRLLDPTCGSGHFLIGAFHALADRAQAHGASDEQAIHLALASVWGCDINPHAVGIAQFRLLLEAHRRRPSLSFDALCALPLNVVTLDSLIPWEGAAQEELFVGRDRLSSYATPQERAQNAAFLGRAFHVVVGNPPYITPKDVQKRDDYRHFWPDSAGGKYALSAPFAERLLRLAAPGGFVGQITANSFMKREFGRGLVTRVLPRWDLTDVIDTSGAYIPGHGTPTVILLARAQAPVKEEVRMILGKRGEPKAPAVPEEGLVWRAIERAGDVADDSNPFITVAWVQRSVLEQHPWSLGGGEAPEIVAQIQRSSTHLINERVESIGITSFTLEDDVYLIDAATTRRWGFSAEACRGMVLGDELRDYSANQTTVAVFPYAADFSPSITPETLNYLWPFKSQLGGSKMFGGKTKIQTGLNWFEYGRLTTHKLKSPLSIAIAFVATHNHFVLDRGGKIFKQSAPVIKLAPTATEDDHLDLLGLLNSSSLGFWMKQVFFNKGASSGDAIRTEDWEPFWEYDSTKLQNAPLTTADRPARIALARALDAAARARSATLPAAVLGATDWTAETLPQRLAAARAEHARLTATMVALQEELDWLTYGSYGLCAVETVGPEEVTPLRPGERPFEVAAARREESGEVEERSAWWSRHGHVRVTEPPALPGAAARRFEERLQRIADDPRIALLEGMAFKRRWQTPDLAEGGDETRRAAEDWLLDSLEGLFDGGPLSEPRPARLEELVAVWTRDPRVLAVAALAAPQTPPGVLAERLIQRAGLPDNPHRLYTEEGWRKHLAWRRVWALQALEDAGRPLVDPDAPGVVLPSVPLPPKFERGDFQRAEHFGLRGKLNVPRERFILYTELSPPRVGWAGWRGLARSQAQVEALALAEGDPVNPQPRPSPERPGRCGVTFGLWESLPSLSRLAGAEAAQELTAVAQDACGQRACPCPLLDAWRAQAAAAPRKGRAKAAPVVSAVIEVEAPPVTVAERAALLNLLGPRPMTEAALLQSLRAQLGAQLNLIDLPPLTEARLPLVIDALVAKGELERAGRGQRRTVKVKGEMREG